MRVHRAVAVRPHRRTVLTAVALWSCTVMAMACPSKTTTTASVGGTTTGFAAPTVTTITTTTTVTAAAGAAPVFQTNTTTTTTSNQAPAKPGASGATFTLAQTQATCNGLPASQGGDSLRAVMDSVRWPYGCVPLYTDDQRLNDGANGYGPLAHAAPLPGDSYTSVTDFNVPIDQSIPVGVVVIDPNGSATVPRSYQDLHLTFGVNCVFFNHDSGLPQQAGWHAYINHAVAGKCVAPTSARGTELPVSPFHVGAFGPEADYPAVGRFHEAVTAAKQIVTQIGFKCAAATCFVRSAPAELKSDHVGLSPAHMTWEVHGWGDEQHVGIPPTPTAPVKPQWAFNSSILPVEGLGALTVADFNNDTVFVAEIYLRTAPPTGTKYETKWHLKQGHNYLFLTHNASSGNNAGWTGIISQSLALVRGKFWELNVARHDHAPLHVLGTARLAWSETDEDGWVRCDDGCCYLSGKS